MSTVSRFTAIAGIVAISTVSACSTHPRLEPAPRASAVPGVGVGAADVEAGVTVEARAGAWSGVPANLNRQVTPVLVKITNGSANTLRIRYNELSLRAADGKRYAAIPPFDVNGAVNQTVTTYVYPISGFTVAPYLRAYYPGLTVVTAPWAFDPVYYGQYFSTLKQVQLPTLDMIQKALPEGYLAPGGSIGGFVYFQQVSDDTKQVTFHADLVNSVNGTQFGSISIPFTVTDAV